ncbi:hypothetical protein KXW10_000404 [Aspergillus fumigatus]|nr:hypothetical protein KXW10_000404 [Aspergillus fumigatus]
MLYSQAFNFSSFIQKGVDPRTGQYTCTIAIYEAPSQARNCPPLNLSLSYSPLNSEDVGFGAGWSFNLSSYQHRQQKTLFLFTGEHYKVTETTDSLDVNDQKLKSFQFSKNGDGDYKLIHKSGLVEILSNNNDSYSSTVPVKLYAASGRSLALSWTGAGEQARLQNIQDESQDLLEINYTDFGVTITRSPNTTEASTFTFNLVDGQLAQLQLPLEDTPSWEFTYDTLGATTCLTGICSPAGLQEEVNYARDGHRLPPGAPYPTIPYVISHTVWPGSQQPMTRTCYSYSDYNFLGYGGDFDWSDGEDNLYRAPAEYQYTSTVQVEDGPQTKYTYNKFHLVVSTQRQKGTKQVTQTVTYHALEDTVFEDQPAQYQLPKRVQTTYRDAITQSCRTETSEHGFDEWGNPVHETPADGITIDRDYYAADGETDASTGEVRCPADPHGFRRYLKTETVAPAVTEHPTPTRIKQYAYRELPAAASSLVDYFVAVEQTRCLENSLCLLSEEYTYVNQPTTMDHGRLQQRVTRVFDQYPTTCCWTYGYPSAEQWTKSTQITSFDGHIVQEETTYSLASGLTLTHTDEAGTPFHFQYDKIGRQVKATVAPGTVHEATQQHQYAILKGEVGCCLTATDAKKVQTRYTTDGLHRIVRVEKQDDDGQWGANNAYTGTLRVVQERNYNALGQCIEAIDIDWLRTDSDPTEQRNSRQLEYDDWGHICKVARASGLVTLTVADPVHLTRRNGIAGEGATETQLNLFGEPTQSTLVTKDGHGYCTTNNTYDGLGRLIKADDGLGHITKYQYDCFDRIILTTWPNDCTVYTQFAAHSAAALPVSITTSQIKVGEQSLDGLARVGWRSVGGRTSKLSYQGNAPQPCEITMPKGDRHSFAYDPVLGYALTNLTSCDDANTFQYDNQTARILETNNAYSTRHLQHLPSGLIAQESIKIKNGPSFSAQSIFSMDGKLQNYTDVHGQKHEIQYDGFGRPQRLTQGDLTVNLAYDPAGRLSESCIQDNATSLTLATHFSYDDFGREVERTVYNGQVILYRLSQTFGKTNLVTTRCLEDGGSKILRHEDFQYDAHSRLTDYQCHGSQLPTDEKANPFQRQEFSFDDIDNLVRVSSTFQDGSENIANYTFSNKDPTQLVRITNTHPAYPPKVDLAYDENGCLTRDEQGRILGYDSMNRLSTVQDAYSKLLSQYLYDAAGKLVCQIAPGKPDTHLHYRGDVLVAVTEGDAQVGYLTDGEIYWGQTSRKDEKTQIQLWASDSHLSTLAWLDPQQPEEIHLQRYTPYGNSQPGPSIGFNGQWRDPVTGWYHLGNGYRVYNPVLMRFHSPDTWCPFKSGEINPYAYCLGDPINRIDPSGHFSIFGIHFGGRDLVIMGIGLLVGIGVGILTGGAGFAIEAGLGIAAGTASDVTVGAIYDAASGKSPTWESVGTDALYGAIGGVVGEGIGHGIAKAVSVGMKGFSETVDQLLKGAEKLRMAGGVRTLAKPIYFPERIGSLDNLLGRIENVERGVTDLPKGFNLSQLKSLAEDIGTRERPWVVWYKSNLEGYNGAEVRLTKDDVTAWTDFFKFRDYCQGYRYDPATAAKLIGDSDLKSIDNKFGVYQFRIGGKHRVTYTLNEVKRIVKIHDLGGHTRD